MWEVLVMAGNILVDSMTFMSEDAACNWASMKQDEGFRVRIV